MESAMPRVIYCCLRCGRDTRRRSRLCNRCCGMHTGRRRRSGDDAELRDLSPLEDDYSEDSNADSVCDDGGTVAGSR
jgi:hypothetical protein